VEIQMIPNLAVRSGFALLLLLAVVGGRPALSPAQSVDPKLARLVPPLPTPEGFIADVPGLLHEPARTALNRRIRAIQDSGLGDIGVAIIPSIADYQPYEVGVAIYRTWRIGRIDSIGSARRDLGVLLLIVPKELAPDGKGQCWISTGRGAEGILTDAVSGGICRDRIIPHLRSRDYAAAVSAGVEAITGRLRGDAGLAAQSADSARGITSLTESSRPRFPWLPGLAGLGLAGAALAGGLWWRRNRPRRCPRCGKPMHRLAEPADDAELSAGQQLEERLQSVDYDVWHCDCGGTLVLPYQKLLSGYKECPSCHLRTAKVTRHIITQPSYTSAGRAEDTTTCQACGQASVKRVVLARLERSSSSSSSSGGGGGGGSSFGGSGSTSGGGGGSSY
jgi:uncharacterized protein